jgi:serralysin
MGGMGKDTADFRNAPSGVTVDLAAGVATGDGIDRLVDIENALGGQFADVLTGSTAANTLDGGRGEDDLLGGGGGDSLVGGQGADSLAGGDGNDSLAGSAGRDTLDGGGGRDRMTGGGGGDHFAFAHLGDMGIGQGQRDQVVDFSFGVDTIDLSGIDADTVQAGDQAFTFIDSAAFGAIRGELRYDAGILEGDVNGDGVADFEIMLGVATVLQQADILL